MIKNLLAILFIFCSSIISYGQGWIPFPQNQASFYKFNYYGSDTCIEMILHDSTSVSGNVSTFLFRTLIQNPGAESCRREIYPLYVQGINSTFSLDSLLLFDDTLASTANQPSIFFLPFANPGQSWIVNNVSPSTIYCDSIVQGFVFGLPDSIKYFHTTGVVPGQQIILSKKFGFIKFIPLSNFILPPTHVFELIGISNSLGQLGFQPPQATDYLPYQTGDILKWHFDYVVQWGPGGYQEYYQDSITQVINYNDSLIYYYDRIKIDKDGLVTFLTSQVKSFSYNGIITLLNTPINDIGVSNNWMGSALYQTSFLNVVHDTIQLNNWLERQFGWNSFIIYSPCLLESLVDGVYDYYYFNTHQGITKEQYVGQGSNWTYYLEGARIGNYTYGNPYLIVGIQNINSRSFSINPNPANDKLYIVTELQLESLLIYDLVGKLILKFPKFQNEIDINRLQPGIYFLKSNFNSGSFTRRFVKL